MVFVKEIKNPTVGWGLVCVMAINALVISFVYEIIFITATGVGTVHDAVCGDIAVGYAGCTTGKCWGGGCAINATRWWALCAGVAIAIITLGTY